MPPSPRPRTLLAQLLVERQWTVDQFWQAYGETAAALYDKPHSVSDRTPKRWVAGDVSRPHPISRRVLKAMFNVEAAELLAPLATGGDVSLTDTGIAHGGPTGDDERATPVLLEEVGSSRRRDLLSAGVVLAAGTVSSSADRAAAISRAMATATPDPLTLAQLQHGIHRLTTLYAVTPHGQLVEPIERAWDDAEALLETRVSGTARRDLELAAGQLAYYRGQLAFDMSDEATALTFFVLAAQHAEAARDSLLAGSVVVMRSALAYFAGEFTVAADVARSGQAGAHPYIAPVLAGSTARALARVGDRDGTMGALRTMHQTVWDGGPLPGPNIGNDEFCESFSAIAFSYLNQGDEAERHARSSLARLTSTGRHVQIAGTQLALGRALIRREAPDPEQAATVVAEAVRIATANGHPRTVGRARAIYRRLASEPEWGRLGAVRELGGMVAGRGALGPGAGV